MQIELIIDHRRIPVAQLGGGRLYFDEPVDLASKSGDLVMTIDGREQRWKVSVRMTSRPSCIAEAAFEDLRV